MRAYAVISGFGPDRVGLVDDISEAILGRSCNIEESKMALLGGEFGVLALVSGEPAAVDGLLADLDAVAVRTGLVMSGRTTTGEAAPAAGRPYRIESVSLDTAGIVHSVTTLLRGLGINIEELDTETSGAPFTGAPMFHMRITAIVPPSVKVGDLRSRLSALSVDQDLDISIAPLRP